jgi:calcineurin-like phosphoesterase family protein
VDEVIYDTMSLDIFGNKVLLNHFPYKGYEIDEREFSWQLEDKGKFLIHGHVHTAWKVKNRMINVGCDVWNYKPVAYPEIVKTIQGIRWAEEGHFNE